MPSLFARASNGIQTELSFDAKWYGPCPEIAAGSETPDLDNVLALMGSRKADGAVVRCTIAFSEEGAVVCNRKSKAAVVGWHASSLASCATIPHPSSKSRRIGLLKIRDPLTGGLCWHLFKYCVTKSDSMTECFRFVVDCGLREIGRAYAAQLAEQQLDDNSTDHRWDSPPNHPQPVPPAYDAGATRVGATMDTDNLRRSSGRSDVIYEDHDPSPGYMLVDAN
jgi:hypothetical protein|eukprot:m.423030 g.423030  ORF g.423030 m.423030 type:complete len:223 (+) comp39573_c0_seq1:190-858(+)